jgi:hypothetical protein
VRRSSNIFCLRAAKFCGASTKSSGCQPAAKLMPTRPFDRLSTSAQSSAMRMGEWSGDTQEPARTCTRFVIAAIAALATAGFG